METNFKEYQITKTKKYFKTNSLFFIFNFSKLNSKEWLKTEQKIKQIKLTHYKTLNGITKKVLINSKHINYANLISGLIIFLKPNLKQTELKIEELIKKLKPLFLLLAIKLNSKIYFIPQISKIKTLSYKKNIFNLHKVLEKSTKTLVLFKKQFEIM